MARFWFLPTILLALTAWLLWPAAALADGPCDVTPPTGSPILWVRADALEVAPTTQIDTWEDQSGNNNHLTQGTDTLRPIFVYDAFNNQPAVQFDGNNDRLIMPFLLWDNADYTILAAARPANDGDGLIWAEGRTSANTGLIYIGVVGGINYARVGDADNDPNINLTLFDPNNITPTIYSLVRNGDDVDFYVNDDSESDSGANNWDTTLNTGHVGAIQRQIGYESFWDGEIHEFIIFDSALSGGQLAAWQNYLQRWTCDQLESICELVPNFHFATNDTWLLAGTSSITNSYLILPPGDSAAQNLATLSSNTAYDAYINVITPTTALNIVLGLETQTINGGAGVYTLTFETETLGGPIIFGFENNDSTTAIIDYACLALAGTGGGGQQQLACLGPPNGNFNTPANWNFQNNASYNAAAKAAFLPYNDPTQSGPYYTPAFIESSDWFTLPNITMDEYLIMQFSAQSVNGQNALITSLTGNQAQTVDQEFIFEVYPQSYNFQADVSLLAGESAGLLFGNDGNYPDDPAYAENINLDDICIFISDSGPTVPTPTDPNAIDPVNLGQFFSCSDIVAFMVAFGIDMRYHQDNYNNPPSVWNPQDWVPWLISAAFVGLEIYLCAFVVFLQSVLNIIEFAINNGLNWAHWARTNLLLAIPWGTSYFNVGYFSAENFVTFLVESASNWGDWLSTNLGTLSQWIGFGFIWLSAAFVPVLLWFLPEINNLARGLLNLLIEDGWNAFIAGLGTIISEVISLLVGIWNVSLLPFLTLFLPTFWLAWLFIAFWTLLWAVIQYVWANVFQTINIPFAFYTGLSEGVNSPAFSNLAGCDGSTSNFWCGMFAALDLVNLVAGHSIFYPIVIVGIVIGTVTILYRNMLALWEFYADWLSRI